MKRLLREPLLHFLLLGALLFAVYGVLHGNGGRDGQDILVGTGQIEHLATTFARTWQRPPSPEEMKGLIDQYVREEIFSREAIKLGLDQDDVIIRRRLQQKMEFIADDLAAAAEPTEAELAAWYARHPEPYREDPRLTFRQVYLSPERHGHRLRAHAASLLAELKGKGVDASAIGDPSLLPPSLAGEPLRAVAGSFGEEFAAAVTALPLGVWSGPVPSGVGAHLVVVEARSEGRLPPLAEVHDAVRRDWDEARRTETYRRFLADLLEQYRVTVAWPARG